MKGPTRQIGFYFGLLLLAAGLGDPAGLINLPVLFALKDRLHLGPVGVAVFEAIIMVPLYLGFVFGFVRDRWRPFGWGDRGYFLLAAPIVVACYLWMAASTIDYTHLLVTVVVAMAAFQLLHSAAEALITSVAQRHLMTGRLSALSDTAEAAPAIIALLAGGWMVSHVPTQVAFLAAAACVTAIVGLALWRPAAVFDGEPGRRGVIENEIKAIGRLIRHRPLWPTLVIIVLWNFSPGWGIPFFYYLTEHVRVSSEVFAMCRAIFYASGAAVAIFYGYLCQRYPLRRILRWVVAVNIPAGFLFLLVHGAIQAMAASVVLGLVFGCAYTAILDLLRRSCPVRLEGTGMMLGLSAMAVAFTVGDLLGAWIYEREGFALCLVIDAATVALILPMLARLPAGVVSTRDGEDGDCTRPGDASYAEASAAVTDGEAMSESSDRREPARTGA